jgi:4-hydroxyphenylpyruvate dioxygenase
METSEKNPCGIQGIGFVELAPTPDMSADALGGLLAAFGFSRTHLHRSAQVDLYRQGQIRFLVNHQPGGFAQAFSQVHGPSISMLGLRVANPAAAFAAALERGAQAWEGRGVPYDAPAIFGLGGSLIAFIDDRFFQAFEPHPEALFVPENGFSVIDHLTNNVEKGTLTRWADFYKEIFGFTEVRSFDIRGERDASAAEKGSESGGLPRLSAAEAGCSARSLCWLRTACDPPPAGRELRSATARSDAPPWVGCPP